MYKNMSEKMQKSKEDSLRIAIVCFVALAFTLIIAYFAGVIDTVEKFNTF